MEQRDVRLCWISKRVENMRSACEETSVFFQELYFECPGVFLCRCGGSLWGKIRHFNKQSQNITQLSIALFNERVSRHEVEAFFQRRGCFRCSPCTGRRDDMSGCAVDFHPDRRVAAEKPHLRMAAEMGLCSAVQISTEVRHENQAAGVPF